MPRSEKAVESTNPESITSLFHQAVAYERPPSVSDLSVRPYLGINAKV